MKGQIATSLERGISTNMSKPITTVIVHDDSYANWVFDPTHPTQGRRFINGFNSIQQSCSNLDVRSPRLAERAELELVHSVGYVDQVLKDNRCDEWRGSRPDLALLAQTFVGGTLVALDALLDGETLTAVHLPGAKHHAQYDQSSGFCVFADFAIAAHIATSLGRKVAIFDFDAHHGDGTENLCADNPNILTFSVHENGIFPGTGKKSNPEKHIYNKPLNPDFSDYVFTDDIRLIEAGMEFAVLAIEFGADIIFVAAGADGHESDPLSNLRFSPGGVYKTMGGLRNSFPTTPILVGGAGGYQPDGGTPEMWQSAVSGLGA